MTAMYAWEDPRKQIIPHTTSWSKIDCTQRLVDVVDDLDYDDPILKDFITKMLPDCAEGNGEEVLKRFGFRLVPVKVVKLENLPYE